MKLDFGKTIQECKEKIKKVSVRFPKVEVQPMAPDNLNEKNNEPVASEIKPTVLGRASQWILYFLAALLPVFFLPVTVYPIDINKEVFAVILTAAAVIAYLLDALMQKRIFYPKTLLISLSIAALVAVTGASAVFSGSFGVSFWGNLLSPDSFLSLLVYGTLFYVASAVLTKKDLQRIGLGFFIGQAIVAVWGLFQLLGVFFLPWIFAKSQGFNTLGGIGNFGIFIACGLVVIVATWSRLKPRQKICLGILGLVIIFELVLLSNIFLWVVLSLCFLSMVIYEFLVYSRSTLTVVIAAVSLFFVFFGSQLPSPFSLPIEVRPSWRSTLAVTGGVWRDGQIFLGSGPTSFRLDWGRFRPASFSQDVLGQAQFTQGFSYALTLAATTGVLGTLVFLFFIFSVGRFGPNLLGDKQMYPLYFAVLFMTVSLCFMPGFFVQLVLIFFGLGMMSGRRQLSIFSEGRPFAMSFSALALLILFIVGSAGLLCFTGFKYVAAINYSRAVASLAGNNLDDSLARLDLARRLDMASDWYPRVLSQALLAKAQNYIQQMNDIGNNTSSQAELAELNSRLQQVITLAIQNASLATEINSRDSLNWANLGSTYENLIPLVAGAEEAAVKNYQQAAALEPTNAAIAFRIGAIAYNKQDIKAAEESLRKAVELNPNYSDAYYLLGLTLDKQEKRQEAVAQFEKVLFLNPDNAQVKKIIENLKAGKSILSGVAPSPIQTPEPEIPSAEE